MGHRNRREYVIAGAYDTETTNINIDGTWHAYVVCYQVNDLRSVSMDAYTPGDDEIHIWRDRRSFLAWLDDCIEWGQECDCIPVVCGYNLLFDLQTVFADLCRDFSMRVSAQSSTNVYTLDLVAGNDVLLRFWDTYHLELRGLEAMGKAAGLPKLVGTWDYSKIRTPATPLTDLEVAYAARDVQVIPAYLRYLCDANEWLKPGLLGYKVITKTSLVRQMAAHELAPIKRKLRNGSEATLEALYMAVCAANSPHCYYDYALRKACFRGGWTFTAARYASVVVTNVASLDVTSMHHQFINGRYVCDQLRPCMPNELQIMADAVLSTTVEDVLKNYHRPFFYAFHIKVRFRNIRLREGTCFAEWGIALIPRGKFGTKIEGRAEYSKNDAAQAAELATRAAGWRDRAINAEFAFGKLYAASEAVLHVSEIELWCIGQVYQWDAMEIILGEGTGKFQLPPDYITLQSNVLFERKQAMKHIAGAYHEGCAYGMEIPASIPDGMAEGLRSGELSNQFVKSYYSSAVKGSFNSIYGCCARDEHKPEYKVDAARVCIGVDADKVCNASNFFDLAPARPKVFYTYGLRIVGGSRMHLCIAMILLYRALGDSVAVTGGDTDSLKVACSDGVTDEDLLAALEPLAIASSKARDVCMRRVKRFNGALASDLEGIGSFEIEENEEGSTRYDFHMEAWNKARISVVNGHANVTCAGLSQPSGMYNIQSFIEDRLSAGEDPHEVLPDTLGYNVIVPNAICHALQRTMPSFTDVFEGTIADYTGNTVHIKLPEAVALYDTSRVLGETDMPVNAENVAYVARYYGRRIDTCIRRLQVGGGVERG